MTIDEMYAYLERAANPSTYWQIPPPAAQLIADKLRELEHDLKNAMHNEGVFGNQVRKLEGDVMGWKTAYETERHEGLQLEARLKEMTDKKNIFMHAHDDLVVTVYELNAKLTAADELARVADRYRLVDLLMAVGMYRKAGEKK